MRRILPSALCLTLAAVALVAASRCSDQGLALPPDTPRQQGEPDDRLDEQLQAAQRRTAAKTELAEEVASGRLGLFEAAARFRDLDAGVSEAYRQGWRHLAEGGSDEERYCRQVLSYVALALHNRPGNGGVILDRLGAELDKALAGGALHLPRRGAQAPPGPAAPAGAAADPATAQPGRGRPAPASSQPA
jgi:hypothetical protein